MNIQILCVCVVLSACAPYAPIPDTPHSVPETGTPADCAAACTNLSRLHCPAGAPTARGATCETVCKNTESSGYASMNPRCLEHITACGDQEDACANQ